MDMEHGALRSITASEVTSWDPTAARVVLFHVQHIGECGQCPHSMHLLQQLDLRVSTLPDVLDLFVVVPDALVDTNALLRRSLGF